MKDWDKHFLTLAEYVASASKDPSTHCGAVIIRPNKTVAATGYNGFPRNMPDLPELYENREEKYSRIIHAEMNALLTLREQANDYTIYLWPFPPCERCIVHIIQSGITRVVSPEIPEYLRQRWGDSYKKSLQYCKECDVDVTIIE
jgi:dCMP deaminase